MKRKVIIITTTFLLTLLVVLFGAEWVLSSMVIRPGHVCNPKHHVYCDGPASLKLDFEEVSFKTSDGLTLGGWFIPAKNSNKVVLFVHGHAGVRHEGLRFAPALHAAGFNLLAFDLRGVRHEIVSMGYHEHKDVRAALDFVLNERGMASAGVLGFSMGAATSILAAEADKRIRALVASSSYANAADELAESARRDYGIPRFPVVTFGIWLANVRGNMKLESVKPEEKIGLIAPRPILIMHCDKDDYIDISHAGRLFARAKEPKQMHVARCDTHEFIWNFNPQEAEEKVVTFFKKNL